MNNRRAALFVFLVWATVICMVGHQSYLNLKNNLSNIQFKTPEDLFDGNP
jgi:hypothetical protein